MPHHDQLSAPAARVSGAANPQVKPGSGVLIPRAAARRPQAFTNSRGVGLAANQIGVDARIFVVDCPDATGAHTVAHVINPVLHLREQRELVIDSEGCCPYRGNAPTWPGPPLPP